MRSAGLDIGSRTVKVAILDEETLVHGRVVANTHDPVTVCRELLDGQDYDQLTATGYGRHLAGRYFGCQVLTEIRAAALGTRYFQPSARTILDIGGQDTKAIRLDDHGAVRKFEMNDRCAAGTGKFLELMATALGYSMPDFLAAAHEALRSRKINSMCAVFAESEVIGLVAQGTPRDELARGLHESIVTRSLSLLKRVGGAAEVTFIGGVAQNHALRHLLGRALHHEVAVPKEPQLVNAVGAALGGVS